MRRKRPSKAQDKPPVDPWGHGYCQTPRSFFNPALNPQHPFNTGEEAIEAWAVAEVYALAHWQARHAIPKGCFAHSLTFFETRWNWSHGKVQRFFSKLVEDGVVERSRRSGNLPVMTRVVAHGGHRQRYTSATEVASSRVKLGSPGVVDLSTDWPGPNSRTSDTPADTKRTKLLATTEVDVSQVGETCPQCGRTVSESAVARTPHCGMCVTRSAAHRFQRPDSVDDHRHASDLPHAHVETPRKSPVGSVHSPRSIVFEQ